MTVSQYRTHSFILPDGTRAERDLNPRKRVAQIPSWSFVAPTILSPSRETDSLMLQCIPAQGTTPGGATAAAVSSPPRAREARLTLAPQPAAVPQARHAVQETLRDWKLDALADTVALLASELLTNAVEATVAATPASSGEQLALTLQHTGPGVLVEVWDPTPAQAIQQDPGPADESGRGLLLVEALSSAWGQYAVDHGKIVWCEVATGGGDRRVRRDDAIRKLGDTTDK